jgi:hypothetical protein
MSESKQNLLIPMPTRAEFSEFENSLTAALIGFGHFNISAEGCIEAIRVASRELMEKRMKRARPMKDPLGCTCSISKTRRRTHLASCKLRRQEYQG